LAIANCGHKWQYLDNETQTRITAMTNKYAEIIARRKAEREADEDQPLRFKLVRTVDGGVSLRRTE
jgi:hypothetical protein